MTHTKQDHDTRGMLELLEEAQRRHAAAGKASLDLSTILAAIMSLLGSSSPVLSKIVTWILAHKEVLAMVIALVKSFGSGGGNADPVDPPTTPPPTSVVWPDRLVATLVSITHEPSGKEVPFELDAKTGLITVEADRINHKSLVYIRVEAFYKGEGLRLDPGTPQGGCLMFIAWSRGAVVGELGGDHFPITSEDDGLPTTAHRIERGVGTREARYRGSSGTECVFNLKTGGMGPVTLYAVSLDDDGNVTATSNSFVTPPVDEAN